MNSTLLILGAGGHALVVADCAIASKKWSDIVFLDDRYPDLSSINGWSVVGKMSDLASFVSDYPEMALGVGVNYENLRLELLERGQKAGACFPSIIHPSAIISPFSSIGHGSVVFAGAVININCRVGSACIINTASSSDHDCVIGNGSHISPGAILAGAVTTGQKVWIGMGAKVLQGIAIGDEAVVGAGSVVLEDLPPDSKAIGIPARVINRNSEPSL